MIEIEIIFHTSSTPKRVDALTVYTKGDLLCVELAGDEHMIVKYPLCNVFSVAHKHGPHWGSTKTDD